MRFQIDQNAIAFALLITLITIPAFGLPIHQENTVSGSAESKDEKQSEQNQEEDAQEVIQHEVVVTATRTEKSLVTVPQPVSVLNQDTILNQAPNTISELFPQLPGAGIVGVGANQSRPFIRGLRGQRILMLADGIRLSNSRRTQSFGEIPALMDIAHIERVEIIRGPASVLYGSEAIGGVINMITRLPQYGDSGTRIFGQLGYRYDSADSQNKAFAEILGHAGKFAFQLSGTYRNAGSYSAPAGSFGNITLNGKTPVNDTGVEDYSLNMFLSYRFAEGNNLSVKFESYNASNSGFGYVDPEVYDPNIPFIRLTYPEHKMQKFTLKYENRALQSFFADGITFLGYTLGNERTFNTDISIAFSSVSGMDVSSSNYTDVNTIGGRLELTKVLWKSNIFTYGADFYLDDSQNTDSSTTTIYGFGPPIISEDSTPSVPNATLRSFGLFLQDDISIFRRASIILGARYQNVRAQTKSTPAGEGEAEDSTDSTIVAAANLLYNLTDNLNVFVSLGRGFRSPNLPERFFVGATPDGGGYQIRNPNLKAETSFNTDLGLRFHKRTVFVEASYFRNLIYDGIQIVPTGNMVGRLPEYQNVNIEELLLQGLEVQGSFSFLSRITLSTNYSYITSKNLTNPELAFADTYGSRFNVIGRYSLPDDWAWLEYHVRHNWDQKDVNLIANPVGDIIPGFTVHSLRGGFTLFKNSRFPQTIVIIVNNLTNTLYSEFTNASFFRPAPERHVVLTWSTRF